MGSRRPPHYQDPRRRAATERVRHPLTPEESDLAKEIAAHIDDLRAGGAAWDTTLIAVDARWPGVAYRIAITGLFWAQLAHDRRRRVGAVQ